MYLELRPLQMLEFMGGLRGVSADRVRKLSRPWLARLDLERHLHKKLGALSKGLQQKVQFLMTFMHQPKLLVLDEPLSGLDPVNVALFTEILAELKEGGAAILYSSHNMDQVERVADQVGIVDNGMLKRHGPIGDLLRESGRFTCRVEYVGEPSIPGVLPVASLDQSFPAAMEGEPELSRGRWRLQKRGRRLVIETTSQAEMQEAARTALSWGAVQRVTLGQMTLQELYLQTVSERGDAF
jgi:ABC-type uncharacterized transport system ATPase subunit